MPQVQSLNIPGGRAGTVETVRHMKRLVEEDKKKPAIRDLAASIIRNCPERDQNAEASALLKWWQDNIRFTSDIYNVETLTAPEVTIRNGYGDCDCLSTGLNATAAAVGFDTAFKVIKADPRIPREYTHVYSMIKVNGRWMGADASQKGRPLGWEPPRQWGAETWGYSNGTLNKKTEGATMADIRATSLEQSFIARFRRPAAKAAAPAVFTPADPRPEPVPPAKPVARVPKFVNAYEGPAFDPDDIEYYGDFGDSDEPAGCYAKQRERLVFSRGPAVGVRTQLLRNRQVGNGGVINDGERFAGRTRLHRWTMQSSVKDGTPKG